MYTLVQHSGYGYAGDPTFEQALEIRSVSGVERKRVMKAGGMLFDTWNRADDAAERLMYPDEGFYLVPRFKGTFANAVVDQLRIAIPEPGE